MDLETENRIASVLMKEAAELRRQADKDGVHAYLQKRNVRLRPNSRFLTATVLGVQQANRVAEVNEMWRLRKVEQELDDARPGTSRDKRTNHRDSLRSTSSKYREHDESRRRDGTRHMERSRKTDSDDSYYSSGNDDGGLKDEDVEHFLHSRVKRGRGGVGARMDEPGPYLPHTSPRPDLREKEDWERRVLGPEKRPSLRRKRSHEDDSEEDNDEDDDKWKRTKKVKSESSKKVSKKHKRKREDRDEERKSRHKHKRRH